MPDLPRTKESQVAVPPTAAQMGGEPPKQTVREQLVEMVDLFLKAFPEYAVDDAREAWGVTNTELIRVYRNDLIAALARARAEPEDICCDDHASCPCYQEGLEVQREPLR